MANGVTITTHYPKSDKTMGGDYYDVTVDFRVAKVDYRLEYGDYYHDKGTEKAEAVVDCLRALFGSKFPVIRAQAADREDY